MNGKERTQIDTLTDEVSGIKASQKELWKTAEHTRKEVKDIKDNHLKWLNLKMSFILALMGLILAFLAVLTIRGG